MHLSLDTIGHTHVWGVEDYYEGDDGAINFLVQSQ